MGGPKTAARRGQPAMLFVCLPVLTCRGIASDLVAGEDHGGSLITEVPAQYRLRHPERTEFYQLFEDHFDSYCRHPRRRPHPAPPGEQALQDSGPFPATSSSSRPPRHPCVSFRAIHPACRPESRPVEVYPGSCAQALLRPGTRGRQTIAGLSAPENPVPSPARACLPRVVPPTCPLRSPSSPSFPLLSRIEMPIRQSWSQHLSPMQRLEMPAGRDARCSFDFRVT